MATTACNLKVNNDFKMIVHILSNDFTWDCYNSMKLHLYEPSKDAKQIKSDSLSKSPYNLLV